MSNYNNNKDIVKAIISVWQVSRRDGLGTESGIFKEPYCTDDCPDGCSTNYWKIYDEKTGAWKTDSASAVAIDCGETVQNYFLYAIEIYVWL